MPAAKKPKPQHEVVDDVFVWHSANPDVGEVRIPLRFKTKILRRIASGELDDLQMLFLVLDETAPDYVDAVDEQDAIESAQMLNLWQAAWNEARGASLPQS